MDYRLDSFSNHCKISSLKFPSLTVLYIKLTKYCMWMKMCFSIVWYRPTSDGHNKWFLYSNKLFGLSRFCIFFKEITRKNFLKIKEIITLIWFKLNSTEERRYIERVSNYQLHSQSMDELNYLFIMSAIGKKL